jgi:hypothetical protein
MTAAVPMPDPHSTAEATTPVIALHLVPQENLVSSAPRRTITTQRIEHPIQVPPGNAIRGTDVTAVVTAMTEEASGIENAGDVWIRLDIQTSEITVGYTTETRS